MQDLKSHRNFPSSSSLMARMRLALVIDTMLLHISGLHLHMYCGDPQLQQSPSCSNLHFIPLPPILRRLRQRHPVGNMLIKHSIPVPCYIVIAIQDAHHCPVIPNWRSAIMVFMFFIFVHTPAMPVVDACANKVVPRLVRQSVLHADPFTLLMRKRENGHFIRFFLPQALILSAYVFQTIQSLLPLSSHSSSRLSISTSVRGLCLS